MKSKIETIKARCSPFDRYNVVKASLALLFLFVPSASVVYAQQDYKKSDDNNTDLSLLMTNYNALREEGQGFFLVDASLNYENPPAGIVSSSVAVHWWCDLEFSSDDADTTNYGYVGRVVGYVLDSDVVQDAIAQGTGKKFAYSISAVLVPTLGIFEGQIHPTFDDLVIRYWDDGNSTLPILGWEGHDEGDTSPNADTSAFSGSGTSTKITTEKAAKYLGMDVADMTPATCSTEYEAAWNATHVPDPIDTSVTTLGESVAQLQADNKALLSRIVAIEGSLTANSSSSGDDGTSLSPFMVWYKQDTTDIVVVKTIMTVAIIIGLVAVDFI